MADKLHAVSTLIFGEEGTTHLLGEEATTEALGEEQPTSSSIGEESVDLHGETSRPGGPFGSF
jgi:hypothetical protein